MIKQTLLSGLKNWQTTALGALGAVSNLVMNAGVLSHGSISEKLNVIFMAIGVMLMGFVSKDADKTGILGEKNE